MYNWKLYINQPVILIDVAKNTLGYLPFFHIVILRELYEDETCKLDFYIASGSHLATQIVSVDYLKESMSKEFDVEGYKKAWEEGLRRALSGEGNVRR